MDDQFQIGQVDAAGGDVSGDADPCPSIAHCLQGMAALGLAQFARQRHHRERAVGQAGVQPVDRRAGVAENDGVRGLVKAQQVDDGVFGVGRCHFHRLIGNVGMLPARCRHPHPERVALKVARQCFDRLGNRGREHQCPAADRGGLEDGFQIFAKAQIQHLVSLVQHHGADQAEVKRPAADMVADPPRRADDNMSAAIQRPAFVAHVHAADTRGDVGARLSIKPGQFAPHLHRQFACRRDDQRQGRASRTKAFVTVQDRRGNRQTKAHRLARAGLRRHQKIAALECTVGDRSLHRGQCIIAFCSEGGGKGSNQGRGVGHGALFWGRKSGA